MTRLHRYGWELTLAALLVIEILGFGSQTHTCLI